MNDSHRSSRADRRRRGPTPDADDNRRRPPPSEVRAYSEVRGDEIIIYLQSILTAENVSHAREAMTQHAGRSMAAHTVVFDLSRCPYIDTPGLSLLYEIKRDLIGSGRVMLLQNASRAMLRMLNLTRMGRVFAQRVTNTDNELIPAARGSAGELPQRIAGDEDFPTPISEYSLPAISAPDVAQQAQGSTAEGGRPTDEKAGRVIGCDEETAPLRIPKDMQWKAEDQAG